MSTSRFIHVEDVMGTTASMELRFVAGAGDPESASRRFSAAMISLRRADRMFSTYRDDSVVMRLARGESQPTQCPDDVREVLDLCSRMRERTNGWFDPPRLGCGIDPTGLVKGWAVDGAVDELRGEDVFGALVNVGGDVAVFGIPECRRRWQVAVCDPAEPTKVALVADVEAAIATSGSYERGAHLVDPRTGTPCEPP